MAVNKKKGSKKALIIPTLSVVLIILFFSIAIIGLNLSGEDILHKTTTEGLSFTESITKTFNYLPRIGEFYQKATIKYFSYQASFGLDLLFRIIDIILCFLSVYIATAVILGRRPKFNYRDSVILMLVFIASACLNSREIYTMRFSYIHNYVPIIILISSVLYIIIRQKSATKITFAGDFLLAFMCGFCNEIAPIALLVIALGKIIFLKRKHSLSTNELKRLITVIMGIMTGLILMLGNGAIIGRSNTSYGAVYDYISFFEVFSSPIRTILRLLIHVAYNIRHLFILIIIVISQIFISFKKKQKNILTAQIICFSFSLLYIIGSSQLLMLDDMESRLMSPAYLGLIIGALIPIYERISHFSKKETVDIIIINLAMLLLGVVAIADMFYLRIEQYNQYNSTFSFIKESQNTAVCIVNNGDGDRVHSVFYDFSSFSPFEKWTTDFGDVEIYGKAIDYNNKCDY